MVRPWLYSELDFISVLFTFKVRTIIVGLGFDYTINEYYEYIAKVVNYQGKFEHDISKPVGMKQKLVNTDKLQQLGWTHKFSLEEGLEKTYGFATGSCYASGCFACTGSKFLSCDTGWKQNNSCLLSREK